MSSTDTCAQMRPELGVYVLGAISPADRLRVGRHLETCKRCRAEVAGLADLPGLLARLPPGTIARLAAVGNAEPHDPAPAAVHVEALARQMTRQRRRRLMLITGVLTAAAAAAAAAAGSLSQHLHRRT